MKIYPSMSSTQLPDYYTHLSKDKKMLPLLQAQGPLQLKKRKNVCLWLCASIMSQQLSTKVADVIYGRFLQLFDGRQPTPEKILAVPFETLRGIGLSNAKTHYVRNVAEYAVAYGMEDRKLYRMSDEEVVDFLLPIKGVGRWTVEMLLMFALGREDVFPIDDFGIRQTMIRLYRVDESDKKALNERLQKIATRWAPYRTYACLHLWRHKDNAPVQQKSKA
jgi:DNA-3-methyladenine glycosylase II